MEADAIYVQADIFDGLSGVIKDLLADLKEKENNKRLFFILTTGGGIIEEVERIVNVVRHFLHC